MHRLFLSVSYYLLFSMFSFFFFFFNDTATTEIYTLSLHDALPISRACEIEQRFGFVHIQIPVERLDAAARQRSEEHTSELQSLTNLVCRLLLEKKKKTKQTTYILATSAIVKEVDKGHFGARHRAKQ